MIRLAVFMLQLLWLAPPSSPNRLSPSVLERNAPRCYNWTPIQYPFAVTGNGSLAPLPGFEIECDSHDGILPMMKLGDERYQLLNISLDGGYVRIGGRAIAWQCPGNTSNASLWSRSVLDLTGTPYTFSATMNKLTATGCDAMALIHGTDSSRVSGCVSFCVSRGKIIEGECSGVGCCQAPVPPGLKSFWLNFTSVRALTGSRNEAPELPCSKAFIVDKEWYSFSSDDLNGTPDNEFRPVVLDWAIGNETCEEVKRRNATDYACKEHSHCIDPQDMVGYRCICETGYAGNPYVPDGCKDIDECEHPETNPCARRCINTMGGYKCVCPPGTRGNGLKTGSGCSRFAALDIALGVGLISLVMLVIISLWAYWGRKKRRIRKIRQRYFQQNGGLLWHQSIASHQRTARIFSSEELEKATDNFNEKRVLGKGGYGTVYKGLLTDGRVVAIKKSKLLDETQIEQFINEVVILSQINHKNVVKLLGCCLETQVPLLVYEFISNGTLFHYIHDNNASSISWENRLRIAVETAGALAYLHSTASVPIIHRDIKSANILLNENYTAKIADFGASRLIPYDQTHITTLVQGTLGYLDPEYFHTSQLTEKSDVYSFGVVLVELLTREKAVSFCRSEEGRNLASYFVMLEENHLLEAVDGQIAEEAGARHLFVVAQLAKRCLSLKSEERPTMKEVAVELDALRRLMKLQFVPKSHEREFSLSNPKSYEEKFSLGNNWNPHNSGSSEQYSMENHLLKDLP